MNRLNNKGYLLVEIILASALAIGMGYFITQITIKTKNKNDDLLVTSLVSTDQGIIYNGIMKEITNKENVTCSQVNGIISVDDKEIKVENKKIIFDNKVLTELTDYAKFGTVRCITDKILFIPIEVKPLPNDNFDIVIHLN